MEDYRKLYYEENKKNVSDDLIEESLTRLLTNSEIIKSLGLGVTHESIWSLQQTYPFI